jgi:5-hydroxyisourate hydrolase
MTSTLSTHVLDVELGVAAAGVPIALQQGDQTLVRASTNADGRIADFGSDPLQAGTYRLVFDVAAYFAAHGRAAPFLQRVSIEFQIDAESPHYHVPLLLSAYACTSYRGS